MCKIIAIANQKGGQSKSTTAVNLAVGLARNGKRVAVVDADPQGSCTASLGYSKIYWTFLEMVNDKFYSLDVVNEAINLFQKEILY